MSPCLISMSLVAMARATSTTTMPTSRGVKSSFGGATPNRHLAKPDISRCEAREAPMIHGIQLGSGRSSVRFASFGEAGVPSLSAALTGGRNDSLAA